MRRGTWILAVSGAMTLNAGGAFAADPQAHPVLAQAGAPTRYSRPAMPTTPPKPPTAPATKSLYDELFGETELTVDPVAPAAKTPTAKAPASPAAVKPAVAAEKAKAPTIAQTNRRPASAPPAKRIPFDSKTGDSLPAAPELDPDTVTQAGHQANPESTNSFIQQVRATGTESSSSQTKPATVQSLIDPKATPAVVVEWLKKSDINVGQECQIELVARNAGTAPATKVELDAVFPNTIRLVSVEPKPAAAADRLSWNFDSIPVGAEKRITITLIPSRRGDLGMTSDVRFSTQAGTTFKVEEPLLRVAVKGPKEILLGDPASQLITISNPGTGTANNVKLEAVLSDGLEHPRGERLTIEIGSIAPGDSQTVRLGLSAAKGGTQTLQVAATSSSEASSVIVEKIQVIAPSLKVAVDGPGLRYKGRTAKYVTTVTNDGTVATNNVRVMQSIPEGFQFVSADKGGKFDPAQKTVVWFVGRMEGSQNSQVSCELAAASLGDFGHQVIVLSDSGARAETKTTTKVKGIASLGTEIVDLNDPVEVGAETAWEVRLRNDGSDAAKNIALVCELPDGVLLMTARGPTQGTVDGKSITFKTLPQLAPGQQAIYRIQVKGTAEGTQRLRAKLTSEALDEPLLMEEATKFYADSK
jgi:uncharacterized repeat protein (TIGR01451 family)